MLDVNWNFGYFFLGLDDEGNEDGVDGDDDDIVERIHGYIYTGTYLYVLVETCVLMSE